MAHLLHKDETLCEAEGEAVTTVAAFLALAAPCQPCIDKASGLGIITLRQWCEHDSTANRRRF